MIKDLKIIEIRNIVVLGSKSNFANHLLGKELFPVYEGYESGTQKPEINEVKQKRYIKR